VCVELQSCNAAEVFLPVSAWRLHSDNASEPLSFCASCSADDQPVHTVAGMYHLLSPSEITSTSPETKTRDEVGRATVANSGRS
jgi:hypothetical protein